ncbi:hypothetical protein Sjap_026633 [Stephania japonica]|uniref:Uncharacterized protein n=1 Tax=Stephania japonica TaxID=461633 RepID=A0AAP0HAQ5_9MAGN
MMTTETRRSSSIQQVLGGGQGGGSKATCVEHSRSTPRSDGFGREFREIDKAGGRGSGEGTRFVQQVLKSFTNHVGSRFVWEFNSLGLPDLLNPRNLRRVNIHQIWCFPATGNPDLRRSAQIYLLLTKTLLCLGPKSLDARPKLALRRSVRLLLIVTLQNRNLDNSDSNASKHESTFEGAIEMLRS